MQQEEPNPCWHTKENKPSTAYFIRKCKEKGPCQWVRPKQKGRTAEEKKKARRDKWAEGEEARKKAKIARQMAAKGRKKKEKALALRMAKLGDIVKRWFRLLRRQLPKLIRRAKQAYNKKVTQWWRCAKKDQQEWLKRQREIRAAGVEIPIHRSDEAKIMEL